MSIINLADCNTTANTGQVACAIRPDIVSYAIALPVGTVIPAAELTDSDTFNTYLAGLTIADTRSQRAYILPFLTNYTDNTGDPVTTNRNNYVATVQSKPYNWNYLMNGSFCAYKNVFELFQNSYYDIMFVDAMGTVWGTTAKDNTGADGVKGYSMYEVFVQDWKQKRPDDIAGYPIDFRLKNNLELITNAAFIASNFQVDTATMGLSSVKLKAGTTASTATTLYVSGTLGCGGVSLGQTYGATLADDAAWTFNNANTGAPITVTGATYNAILDEYALTLSSTPATPIVVGMAAPSVLTATPFFAYIVVEQGDKLTITTP